MNKQRLYEWLNPEQQGFYTPKITSEIPDFITSNLKDELREYQKQSLRNTIYMLNEENASEIENNGFQNKHLLYNMATGSGKTIVMASLILYMYKKYNYQNFIFFVNSEAVIQKTRENMFNQQSSKFLFNPKGVIMDGNRIFIEAVDNFPSIPSKNTIYLKLTTIHGLHNDMNESTYRENSLTYEDLKAMDVVLLGDEAHHYNSLTKSKKLDRIEREEQTWENTVQKILYSNKRNKLFEFTATLNMYDKNINDKYSDKIIYSYDLRKYMNDGFSKNVMRIQSDTDDNSKMMDAVFLSQFRKIIARENGVEYFKPLIMFKSNKIVVSNDKEKQFYKIMDNMNIENVNEYIKERLFSLDESNVMYRVYNYYMENENLSKIINELKEDFSIMNIINVNKDDKKDSMPLINESNAHLLNTLEERDNPIRAIFAVAKLNEGWDVLNLFDIVRIGETASNTLKSTDAEAQLIGRGARYYPYEYKREKSQIRRFDNSNNDMALLEQLHYHTTNDSKYLFNLHKSLDSINLVNEVEGNQHVEKVTLKEKFRKSEIYKNRSIFVNETVKTSKEDFSSLESYNITSNYLVDKSKLSIEENILENSISDFNTDIESQYLKVDFRYIKKAMQRNPFYQFSNLKKYIPIIKSKKQLMEDENFFGNISIQVKLPNGQNVNDLKSEKKLEIVDEYFEYCADKFRRNYMKEKGTDNFVPIRISEVVKDYSVVINSNSGNEDQVMYLGKKDVPDWYVYNEKIMNNLESSLLNYINEFSIRIKEKYKTMYLIRNDERNTRIALKEFDGIRGFMPDFILYLEDNKFAYQIFIEPKGKHLVLKDKWKEDFLEKITKNKIEVIDDGQTVKILGTKFYKFDRDEDFRDDLAEIISLPSLSEKLKLFDI